jgi:hypothetical protein
METSWFQAIPGKKKKKLQKGKREKGRQRGNDGGREGKREGREGKREGREEAREIMSFAEKCSELKIIMLSEINQTQEDKYCTFFSNMWNLDLNTHTRHECERRNV